MTVYSFNDYSDGKVNKRLLLNTYTYVWRATSECELYTRGINFQVKI